MTNTPHILPGSANLVPAMSQETARRTALPHGRDEVNFSGRGRHKVTGWRRFLLLPLLALGIPLLASSGGQGELDTNKRDGDTSIVKEEKNPIPRLPLMKDGRDLKREQDAAKKADPAEEGHEETGKSPHLDDK